MSPRAEEAGAGLAETAEQLGAGRAAPPPVTAPVAYRLEVVHRYGVPLSNATGVACEGEYVWLMGGAHNASTNTLVHANLATGAIDRTYTYENLIEQLGTGVYGIAKLDDTIYVSVAGNTNKIVSIDAQSGTVVKENQAPTTLGPSDLDVSDGKLVQSSGTGDVYTLEPTTGALLADFSAGDSGRNYGVAVRGGEAFVGSLFGGMDVFVVASGKLLGHVTKLDGSELEQEKDIGAMCFNGSRLLILSSLGLAEYEVRAGER